MSSSGGKRGAGGDSRHYYLAVGNTTMKLPTLTNLLHALSYTEPNLCVIIVCNCRAQLDELVSALTKLRYECSCLHSDMHSKWRKAVLDGFNNNENSPPTAEDREDGGAEEEGGGEGDGKPKGGMSILLSSDVCLPRPSSEELTRDVRLVINYDIPMKKEQHLKRVKCILGSRGIFINFLVANEVSMLKALESYTAPQSVEEMPLILSDLFVPT